MLLLSVCVVSACSKKDNTDKKNTKKESNKKVAKELADYEDLMEVLCESKVKNDVDEFLTLFDYMKSLMSSVVTEDDTFAKISEGYKQECGEDLEWSYKMKEANKIPEESLKEYQEIIQVFGSDGNISEAYDLVAEVEIRGNKGTKEYMVTFTAGKIGDKWQIVNFDDTLMQ